MVWVWSGAFLLLVSSQVAWADPWACVNAGEEMEKRYAAIRKVAKDKVAEMSRETREFIEQENPGVGGTAARSGESFRSMREFIRERKAEAEYFRRACANACESKPDIDPHKRKCEEKFRGLTQELERDSQAAEQQLNAANEVADSAAERNIADTLGSNCGEKCKTDPIHDVNNESHPYHYPGRERIVERTKVEDRDLEAIRKMESEAFVGARSFQVEYNGQTEWVTVRRNERGVMEFDWDRSGPLMDQRSAGYAASGTQYRYGQYRRSLERSPSALQINFQRFTPVPRVDP